MITTETQISIQRSSSQAKGQIRQVPRLTSCGSQAGDQCLLKGGIFLFRIAQLKIGYGWWSMAHIWILTHLREPLSTVQPSIHWLSALLELILGRLQEPPVASGSLQFCLPPYSISDFSPTVKPYFFCCFLGREEWRERGGILVYVRQYAVDGPSEILASHWSSQINFDQWF